MLQKNSDMTQLIKVCSDICKNMQDMSKDISEIKSYSSDISRLQDIVSQNHALVKACTDTSKDVREIKNRFKDVTLHHHNSASLGVKVMNAKASVWS